ncbi:MAG: SelB C-terminal domain-containing protein [Gemmatimonadota bacterium]
MLEGREGPVGPGPFKEAFDVTRSYLIPLLEYLDRTGLTRRTGDGRVLEDPEAAPAAD